jgi:hypothetical protein
MGVRSFLIAVDSSDDIEKIKNYSEFLGTIWWSLDLGAMSSSDILFATLFLFDNGDIKLNRDPIRGDTDLHPVGFKYYCGKIWLLISTWSSGEDIVPTIARFMEKNYTRLWDMPPDYNTVPTILVDLPDNDRDKVEWQLHIDKFNTILRETISYDDILPDNFIRFKDLSEEDPEIYAILRRRSDS